MLFLIIELLKRDTLSKDDYQNQNDENEFMVFFQKVASLQFIISKSLLFPTFLDKSF